MPAHLVASPAGAPTGAALPGRDVEVVVLGPLQVRVDGTPASLGGLVRQAVLAVLLCAGGEPVTVERLLREVWPEVALRPDRKSLAAHVSRLRRLLPGDAPIEHLAGAYRLAPVPRTDAQRFADLLAVARAARASGDEAGARSAYVDALALWRGEPFAGIDAETVAVERTRLAELALQAREELAEVRLALDEPVRVVEDLAALATADPPRERALSTYARALLHTGRRQEALEAVRRGRRALSALGAGPSSLDALETALLRDDPPPVRPPRRPAPDPRPERPLQPAPRPVSSFVGNGALLLLAARQLEGARCLSLVGPGGVGKTRLALELLRAHPPEQVAFVPLAALTDAELLGAVVGDAVGASDAGSGGAVGRVAGAIGERPLLLVLDNCEHVLDAVRPLAERLLGTCPRLRLLVTSREPLAVPGEHLLEVPPLPVTEAGADGPAVQLFLDRLGPQAGWAPDEADLAAVRRICADLDGLPLAVELAAARCRTLAPTDVLRELDDRFRLLQGTGAAPTAHHGSLLTALRWSYELLSEQEQQHFRALARFEGGFELDAAGAVLGAPAAAAVADLVAKSLLTVDRSGRPWRYGMLRSLRDFAATCTPAQEAAGLARRHVAWAAGLAAEGARQMRRGDALAQIERLERERPNLRAAIAAAIALGDVDTALAMTHDLAGFWFRRGHGEEALAMLRTALQEDLPGPAAGPPTGAELPRARALVTKARLHLLRGESGPASDAAARGVALAEGCRSEAVLAEACGVQALASALRGEAADAEVLALRGREAAAATGRPVLVAQLLHVHGLVRQGTGDEAGADALFQESVALAAAAGHRWTATTGRWLIAKGSLSAGDAASAARQAVGIAVAGARDGNRTVLLLATLLAGACLPDLGRPELAWRLLGAVEGLAARTGQRPEALDPKDTPWLLGRIRAVPTPGSAHEQARGRAWDEAELLTALAQLEAVLPPARQG